MSLSTSVFKPYVHNYLTDGSGRDTYVMVNDQRCGNVLENANCNWKIAHPNFYHEAQGLAGTAFNTSLHQNSGQGKPFVSTSPAYDI